MATEVLERTREVDPLVVHTSPVIEMDDKKFFQFCQINRDLRIERNAEGDIIIMAPAGGSSGRGETRLATIFDVWAEQDGTGEVFGSSTGFTLPNKAIRAPMFVGF
jgi:Uma2 family endonuclease